MGMFCNIINSASFTLNIIGALITIWGIIVSLVDFLKKEMLSRKEVIQLNEAIRIKLGSYLVLALEFFIAGDIVKTITTPTWQSLGILGGNSCYKNNTGLFLNKRFKEDLTISRIR